MNNKEIEILKKISKEIIDNIEKKIKENIGKSESKKFIKIGADGTPTQYLDIIAEEEAIKVLKNLDFTSFLISEEIGELRIGNGSKIPVNIQEEIEKNENLEEKFIFLIDPLDGTNNALKQIPAYGVSIAIAEIPKNSKIATLEDVKMGFVKNLNNGDFYEAIKGKGSKLNDNPVTSSIETNLSKAFLGGFLKKSIEGVFDLVKKVRRIRLLGSVALELSFVADGKYNIFVDFRKSKVIDIAASKLIVEESGGIVTDEFGKKLKNKLSVREKTIIIGSGNKEIHEKILKTLNNSTNEKINSIGIVSRLDNKEAILFAGKLIQTFLKQNIKIEIEDSLSEKLESLKNQKDINNIIEDIKKTDPKIANELKDLNLNINFKELGVEIREFQTDIIITLGGDGTILRTQSQIKNEIPIFGINMGTVGFLTEIEIDDTFERMKEIIKGNYYKEKRTQLIVFHGKHCFTALNEVVIMTEKPAKMLSFEVRVDGEVIEEFRADGLIISTPSGSTAYSMSAGGPIVDPKLGAFIIIPICPYKLGLRPFVISNNSEIKVKLLKKGKKAIFVMDGQINKEINYLEEIRFKKSENDVYFIRNKNKEFYQKVKEKLTEGGITSDREN